MDKLSNCLIVKILPKNATNARSLKETQRKENLYAALCEILVVWSFCGKNSLSGVEFTFQPSNFLTFNHQS